MQQQKHKIGIVSWGSVSALGNDKDEIWEHYLQDDHFLSFSKAKKVWEGALSNEKESDFRNLKEEKQYASLDRSVHLAMFAAREAFQNSNWKDVDDCGVNIGSSRGATQLWEKFFAQFQEGKKLSPLASPSTTAGNISSWVAHYLGLNGLALEHSITCSTALHGLLNAMVWLESGRSKHFMVGGSEAALTPFTLSQMQALRIYAKANDNELFPCKSLDLGKTENTMVLGEGAACFGMERDPSHALAWIEGVGYAREQVRTATAISVEGEGFQHSMKMALAEARLDRVDVVVCHAPGTIKGDQSEVYAINQIWSENPPVLTSNKWKVGHTFGASGALSLELALLMLQNQHFIGLPFGNASRPMNINSIMVNAMGFGGNAVSVILKK